MVKLEAKCKNLYTISVTLKYDSCDLPLKKIFTLIEDGVAKEVPTIVKEKNSDSLVEYELKLINPLVLGHLYQLSDEKYQTIYISTNPLLKEEFFDEVFTYDKKNQHIHTNYLSYSIHYSTRHCCGWTSAFCRRCSAIRSCKCMV